MCSQNAPPRGSPIVQCSVQVPPAYLSGSSFLFLVRVQWKQTIDPASMASEARCSSPSRQAPTQEIEPSTFWATAQHTTKGSHQVRMYDLCEFLQGAACPRVGRRRLTMGTLGWTIRRRPQSSCARWTRRLTPLGLGAHPALGYKELGTRSLQGQVRLVAPVD